jgi:hypothetical protein
VLPGKVAFIFLYTVSVVVERFSLVVTMAVRIKEVAV